MEIFYILVSVSLVGGSAVTLMLAVFSFLKQNQLFMLILSGAMLCFCLGELYWITYLSVEGVTPSGFHVPDLSFIGYYLFLITGEFGIVNERIRKEMGKNAVRFAALVAPVLMSGVSVFLILLGGRAFATIAYLIPSAVLAYFSLRNLLCGFRAHFAQMRCLLTFPCGICLPENAARQQPM